jgi:hypothetical protein
MILASSSEFIEDSVRLIDSDLHTRCHLMPIQLSANSTNLLSKAFSLVAAASAFSCGTVSGWWKPFCRCVVGELVPVAGARAKKREGVIGVWGFGVLQTANPQSPKYCLRLAFVMMEFGSNGFVLTRAASFLQSSRGKLQPANYRADTIG